ncbi:scarecrow-like protein 21 isoform X6 [Triticum aestivum]|uniref:scarecrow-like protein 21 isoform X6 n=1 Tax=Triticum aestivum TaxID=4565 RepID=UPI001D035431|nr:scarecrow-like protein 21 isoform X6 [Triticum aestivum]
MFMWTIISASTSLFSEKTLNFWQMTYWHEGGLSTTVTHATTCDPGVEIYSYGVAEENCELLFTYFYDLVGVLTNGDYVPASDLDQFQQILLQLKVKSWKLPAFKKFEERENSGVLIPDYLMMNGCPVRAVSLNNDAGPSVQARTIWQYPNDMAAQHVFSDRHPLNGFSRAAVLSNNGAGPSNQGTLPFSQPTYEQTVHQGNGQHDPSMAQNGIPDYLPQGNILNDQGSLSAQPTPFHNFLPVPADEMITGASLTDEQTEYFSTTDSLGTLENAIPGPELDISCDSPKSLLQAKNPLKQGNWRQLLGINTGDLKQVIIACGKAAAENDIHTEVLISELRQLVSISGDPMQRLGAYMLEGLVARFSSSGSKLYKSLKYKEPTSSELMSYMHLLYEMCPFYMFGYMSANGAIAEAIKGENFVHIIDFQIAQGSQWITIIQALAARSGGPPCLRITGIDDSNSAYARGGGLDMVGTRLHSVSASCGVPFEFNAVHAASHEVYLEHLDIRPGEVIVVNFAYQLHHTPDESVSTENHRDRIIRMIKSLAPRVVTLVEQESNTNTTPFFQRYLETLDYYTAIFEIIDVALPRDDKTRISTEQHCLARDIISLIACEGAERVERHEVFGKWKARFAMAGFRPYPLSSLVNNTIKTLLDGYHRCYRLEERDGVLYLGWKSRMLVVSSAWR